MELVNDGKQGAAAHFVTSERQDINNRQEQYDRPLYGPALSDRNRPYFTEYFFILPGSHELQRLSIMRPYVVNLCIYEGPI